MAPGMKYWIGMVAVGMALVAAWRLPPASFPEREVEVTTAQELRYQKLNDDYRWTTEALRRVRWSDSLSALVVERAERGLVVLAPTGSALDETMLRQVRESVRDEIDALDNRSSDMVFGLVYLPYDHHQEAGMPASPRDRTETYIGSREGTDYCMQIRVHHPATLARALAQARESEERSLPPGSQALGPCRFYLRYGVAGDRVQEWLEDGGLGFAILSGKRPAALAQVPDRMRFRSRTTFGFRIMRFNRPIEADQCLSGRAEACGTLFAAPLQSDRGIERQQEIVRRSPVASIGGPRLRTFTLFDDPYLLADLESEFGPAAFGRFWTSEAAVTEAFEEAFGIDVGSWVVTWIESAMPLQKPGPGLPRSASSGSMLAVSLLVGLAFMRNRKRRVT